MGPRVRGDDEAHCRILATHFCPRPTISFAPSNRGRREDRVRAAPEVSCAIAKQNAHMSIQVQRKHSGLPCAMVLRLIRALPGGRAVPPSLAVSYPPT